MWSPEAVLTGWGAQSFLGCWKWSLSWSVLVTLVCVSKNSQSCTLKPCAPTVGISYHSIKSWNSPLGSGPARLPLTWPWGCGLCLLGLPGLWQGQWSQLTAAFPPSEQPGPVGCVSGHAGGVAAAERGEGALAGQPRGWPGEKPPRGPHGHWGGGDRGGGGGGGGWGEQAQWGTGESAGRGHVQEPLRGWEAEARADTRLSAPMPRDVCMGAAPFPSPLSTGLISPQSSQQPHQIGRTETVIPVLQMKKLRFRVQRWPAQEPGQ